MVSVSIFWQAAGWKSAWMGTENPKVKILCTHSISFKRNVHFALLLFSSALGTSPPFGPYDRPRTLALCCCAWPGWYCQFLVFPVAALYFAVVAWCVRPDELMAYAEFLSSGFKERGDISFWIGKPVGKVKAIVGRRERQARDSTLPSQRVFQK